MGPSSARPGRPQPHHSLSSALQHRRPAPPAPAARASWRGARSTGRAGPPRPALLASKGGQEEGHFCNARRPSIHRTAPNACLCASPQPPNRAQPPSTVASSSGLCPRRARGAPVYLHCCLQAIQSLPGWKHKQTDVRKQRRLPCHTPPPTRRTVEHAAPACLPALLTHLRCGGSSWCRCSATSSSQKWWAEALRVSRCRSSAGPSASTSLPVSLLSTSGRCMLCGPQRGLDQRADTGLQGVAKAAGSGRRRRPEGGGRQGQVLVRCSRCMMHDITYCVRAGRKVRGFVHTSNGARRSTARLWTCSPASKPPNCGAMMTL